MKLLVFKLFFCLSILAHSQIGLNFDETQIKFGYENLSKSLVSDILFEVKRLSDTETIKLSYNGEHIVDMIEVESTQLMDETRFHELAQNLNPNFMLTSSQMRENSKYYYDSKNLFLNIKVYKTNQKTELSKIIFISDPVIIADLIPNIKEWK